MREEHQAEEQKNRSAAKAMVRESWQQRRLQQKRSLVSEQAASWNSSKEPTAAPSVCHFVSTTWKQLWNQVLEKNRSQFVSQQDREALVEESRNEVQQIQENYELNRSTVESSTNNRKNLFPSVLSIFQQHALVQHVHESRDQVSVLSGDWETAMRSMIRQRSRVVWLVDVASIVRNAVAWNHQWESHIFGVYDGPKDPLILDCMRHHRIVCRGIHVDGPVPGKPDSMIREWDLSVPLTVDGADEVDRIRATIRRVRERRKQPMVEALFILRLDSKMSSDSWKDVYDRTCEAMVNELVGISVDSEASDNFVDKLKDLLFHMEKSRNGSSLQIHLTGPSVPKDFIRSLHCYDIYLDAELSAGALCTRVIGVREQDNRRHYYIDDGCYGSLTQQVYDPVPLLLTNHDTDDTPRRTMMSTVWGPTCDGLDRVCESIQLPVLQRDDWLVFPSTGAQSQNGTAFNGFDPPDTAYCVVGYFDGKQTQN